MVLELIVIGAVVYYYYNKNHKQKKLKKAAFLAGEPYYHNNGAVTYPPGYPDLPPYTATAPPMSDYKRQIPIQSDESVARQQPYSDAVPVRTSMDREKVPLVAETREIMNEKN